MKKIISIITNTAKKYNVSLVLYDGDHVLCDNLKIPGYFQTDPAILVANVNELECMAHEYCHMLQWIDNDYRDNSRLTSWLGKTIELTPQKLSNSIGIEIYSELDCERRVVKLIKKHDLDLDIDSYIQKANAYILSYHFIEIYRKWPIINPSTYTPIWKKMPKKFVKDDFYFTYPTVYEHLFQKCF